MRFDNGIGEAAARGRATGAALAHDSATGHVTGGAHYVDDLPEFAGMLHLAVGRTGIARGRLTSLDLDAVRQAPGVVCVLTAADVPGHLDIGPVFPGDPLLVVDEIQHHGQPMFVVAATDLRCARRAAALAEAAYEEESPVIDVADAIEAGITVRPPHVMHRGDPAAAIAAAPRRLSGSMRVGGQEHFYLEGQAALAVPRDDGGMHVVTSNQNPTEVQKLVAEVLGLPMQAVTAEVRRMGGGFGGKETQANPWACLAALVAHHTGRPAKCRLPRVDDMVMTGKRHDFLNRYDVGFDDEGRILGIDYHLSGRCGCSPDLSDAIVDRAMFHCDNAYYLPAVHVEGHRWRTHTVSNTAFRGFGGPQGMIAMEAVIDEIARATGLDPLDVRKRNLYRPDAGQLTPYHQEITHFTVPAIIERLERDARYRERRDAIAVFNASGGTLRRGIALTPVKFGISFTVTHLNQAGALLHVYTDGTVHLNHGGTEMGQGLFTKVRQIVADELGVDVTAVGVSATRTDKVPNTAPTAASSGTDLNGMAARNAARTVRERLAAFVADRENADPGDVVFDGGRVRCRAYDGSFADTARAAWFARVPLSATGFYKTPDIHYDRDTGRGRPFFYFANGAAVSEVVVDTLTGEYRLLGVDILHDVGNSINPAVDVGQIEGGFVQGLGWLTTEELKWDDKGRLLSNAPANYKIPAVADVPAHFNVSLLEGVPNREETVYRSKAVGEPPLMLAISAWCAIRDAVSSLADYRLAPRLDAPATCEHVLAAIEDIRERGARHE